MGLVVPSLGLAACKDPPSQVATAEAGSTSETAGSSGSSGSSTKEAPPPPPPPRTDGPGRPVLNMPSCPNGAFCVDEGGEAASSPAPPPFGKCALSVPHPDTKKDAGAGRHQTHYAVTFDQEGTRLERTKTPSACCYRWVMPCPGGRAFRGATGGAAVARVVERDDWTATLGAAIALAIAELGSEERAARAEHWTREAAFEHASIASFAQLTLDLLAAGAPPALLAGAQRAALDEIEHAQIAFALATAYGSGAPVGPGALVASPSPAACSSLAKLARATFLDACIGESVASAMLAERARTERDPALAPLLSKMSQDEERHAELAWRIVAWALRSGDAEVGRAVSIAQAEVAAELATFDDHAPSSESAVRATVLREVVLPCATALLGSTEPAGRWREPRPRGTLSC